MLQVPLALDAVGVGNYKEKVRSVDSLILMIKLGKSNTRLGNNE